VQGFSISIYLISGFFTETIGFDTLTNWDTCKSLSVSLYDYTLQAWTELTAGEIENYIQTSWTVLVTLDTAAEDCFLTKGQIETAYTDYGVSFEDAVFLAFNLIYHAGVIYDLVIQIIDFFVQLITMVQDGYVATDSETNTMAENIGSYVGEILRQIFKN